jgi:hypothetical protein
LIKRNAEKWGGQIAYTWSRLYGNYAGLSDTYYTDGNGGRHEPNNGRAFDLPNMLFDGQGHVANGPLPTDRPNTFGGFGYYRLKWFGQETLIGFTQQFAQGTPQSTCVGTVDSASSCQFVAGQGNWINFHQDPVTGNIVQDSVTKGKRTPFLVQSDLNFTHEVKVSKTHEGMRLGFNANITNVFNQRVPLVLSPSPLATGYTTPTLPGGAGCSAAYACPNGPISWDYQSLETNFNYLALMNDKSYAITDKNPGCADATKPCPDYTASYTGPNTNGKPNTLASRYGKAVIFQGARSMRLEVKFTF